MLIVNLFIKTIFINTNPKKVNKENCDPEYKQMGQFVYILLTAKY